MEIAMILFVILTVPTSISFGRSIDASEKLAKPGEFPHMVQLYSIKTGETFCSGSIIHPSVILTPARCLQFIYKRQAETILVTGGTLSLKENKTEEGEQTRTVAHYEIHPNYNPILLRDNLALVFLTEPFNLTEKVQPIRLPSTNQMYSWGTVTGWGLTDWDNVSVSQLSKFDLYLNERDDCNKESFFEPKRFKVTDTELCAKLTKESGICKITMGSSFLCEDRSGPNSEEIETSVTSASVLCGMATWAKGNAVCGDKGLNKEPISVFLEVSKYVDWIQARIEENLKNCSGDLFDCGLGQETRCIPAEKCNGVNDCPNGSDETEVLCRRNDPVLNTTDVKPEGQVKVEEVNIRQETENNIASEKSSLWLLVLSAFIAALMFSYFKMKTSETSTEQ